jgi:hypothetical protein
MTKKFLCFILFLAFSLPTLAQTETPVKEKRKGRPDIPGTFAIDLGFNLPSEKENFNTGIFGSRTLNVYYYYDMPLWKSKFSLHPGIGVGLERYKFNNNRTLGYIPGSKSPFDTLRMVRAASLVGSNRIKKSQLITNYLDIPVELRFTSNPSDPARSFKASIGFKFGILYDSFTKIKYSQDGEIKKVKDKQDFNLNPFRYGVTAKVSVGTFSVYSYMSLSPLFKDGKGPAIGNTKPGEISNFTIGFSLAAF